MTAVKGKDTTPELTLRRTLWRLGVRGWRCHRQGIPGRPDLSFSRAKLAVFVDGAFWHGHPDKYWQGRSGPYWDAKIARNQERDARINGELESMGWRVLRIWDFEVNRDAQEAARRVITTLNDPT